MRDLLTDEAQGCTGLPYLPELPARGPGADLVGRTAALLPDLPVDLQPSGWRLSGGAGRDLGRARAYWQQDLDELAEAYDGYTGPLKVALCGPWTLAATVALPRGEKVLSDHGARRDLQQSLGALAVERVGRVRSLVPGAEVVLQLDEPALPGVLSGTVPTSSGFGRLRSVTDGEMRDALTELVDVVGGEVAEVVVHVCAADPPLDALCDVAGLTAAVDAALLTSAQWDVVARLVEVGRPPWLGIVPTTATGTHPAPYVEPLVTRWSEIGLPVATLAALTLSPACGLAGCSPDQAQRIARLVVDAARDLTEVVAGA